MAIDFRYVPTSGSLSGTSFEKQTEQAFNELGQQIDDTAKDVSQALDVAQNARATAQNALQTAETANSAAQDAHSLAQNARNTADNAVAIAGQAKTAADDALGQANVATTTANNARDSAEQAKDLATSVLDTAADAKNSADSALAAAQSATDVAEQATGIFFVDDTVRDANEAYTTTEKSFLTNSDPAAPNTNFPDELSTPLWFSVYMTDDGTAVTQTCWNDAAGEMYMRAATMDSSESDDPMVTWGEWTKINAAQAAAEAAQATADAALTAAMKAMIVGEIRLLPFRTSQLPAGWYFCNGDRFQLASAQGVALNGLSAAYKADWGITVSGSTINLPNMFYTDGRGYFFRTVNGSSRQVGSVEIDQMRPITGTHNGIGASTAPDVSGSFYRESITSAFYLSLTQHTAPRLGFSSGLLGPNYNGADTHPLNRGMTPAIYLGV